MSLRLVRPEVPTDGMFEMLAAAARRYARNPADRESAARMMSVAAIHLHAAHAGAGKAERVATEALDLAKAREGR